MTDGSIWNRKSWAEGSSDITIGQLEKQMKCLEKEIGDLLVAKVALRTSTYSLAGSEMDFERWNKESHANDWSYLDLICSRFTEPSTSTVTLKKHRDVNQQSRWRNSVLKAYGADKEKSDSTLHWCPIAGGWVIRDLITVAHIVRHNVTELAAEHLFGLAETKAGHIWSVKNGMPMLKCYEKMLDDASIVIIPTNDGKDLMVRVLDTNVSNKFGDTLTKEEGEDKNEEIIVASKKGLDGRILKFRTDFRPAKRYLYFGFAINILRRQRYESDGWWRDRVHFASTPFFSTPGKWVNETTLKKLAVRVGHLTPDEAENFGAMARDGKRGNEDPFLDQPQPEEDDYEEVQTCTIQRAYRQR
ncbi:hypothetical protein GGS21DRAFT_502302 [Xylaria nigripes]|nr:hypothetical protein GGS21DRAFT_502302 [Xylaria nigripes]